PPVGTDDLEELWFAGPEGSFGGASEAVEHRDENRRVAELGVLEPAQVLECSLGSGGGDDSQLAPRRLEALEGPANVLAPVRRHRLEPFGHAPVGAPDGVGAVALVDPQVLRDHLEEPGLVADPFEIEHEGWPRAEPLLEQLAHVLFACRIGDQVEMGRPEREADGAGAPRAMPT